MDDGCYIVKNGEVYKVDLPIDIKPTKIVNIMTGEIRYPTNYDKITHMSVEELSEWLERIRLCCATDLCGRICPFAEVCYSNAEAPKETLDWLEQGVKE